MSIAFPCSNFHSYFSSQRHSFSFQFLSKFQIKLPFHSWKLVGLHSNDSRSHTRNAQIVHHTYSIISFEHTYTRTASSALNTRTTVSITQLTVKYDAIKCGTNCLHLWKNYLPLNTYSKLMYVSTLWSCRFVCCFYVCICRRCNFVWACLSVCLSVCLCVFASVCF